MELLRELGRKVAEIAANPVQEERRELWRRLHSLEPGAPPLVHVRWFGANREIVDHALQIEDPLLRGIEHQLRSAIFAASIGDDTVIKPWVTVNAVRESKGSSRWGPDLARAHGGTEGGSFKTHASLRGPEDMANLVRPRHVIDEAATVRDLERVREALGGVLEVNLSRAPIWSNWHADIATCLGWLRGVDGLMWDMIDRPEWLHEVLSFMRDGILSAQDEAELAGDWGLTDQMTQSETYCRELPEPRANSGAVGRKQLWCFMAAQELTLVSPEMHDEFMLQYQIPIMEKFGLSHYGCCEDLTRKIDHLRRVRNLRRIAIAPRADVEKCAEQLAGDYVASWRPNPAETVCCGFNEERIRLLVRKAKVAFDRCGTPFEVNLKDIQTVEGQPERLAEFARIVKSELGR